nr:hypothetical protein [Sorangium cellulosum]
MYVQVLGHPQMVRGSDARQQQSGHLGLLHARDAGNSPLLVEGHLVFLARHFATAGWAALADPSEVEGTVAAAASAEP